MGDQGLVGDSPASPPYSNGPYEWDQQVTFSGGLAGVNSSGKVLYVDGNNGSDGASGKGWGSAKKTIQAAVTAVGGKGTVFVAPIDMAAGATDPGSYEENIVIPATHESLSIIGVSRGRTQGGLPQLKDGATTTQEILVIRAPGCLIQNLGFNGSGNTGGGILLDDDGSTKTAFGTSIIGCHFKNCKGTTATNAATGGAINWETTGGAFQVLISGNRFYKNVGDIVLLGTSQSVPQDVVIENNVFSGPAASVDCNLYLQGGSGMNGVIIRNNVFTANPAIGSGTNADFLRLTGCVGVMSGNMFAASTAEGGTEITFGATGDNTVPTTMFMAANYGEFGTGVGAGLISGEIFRT